MNITQFDRFRINSESGIADTVFIDVEKFDGGCSNGFIATAYEIPSLPKDKWSKHKVEVRRKDRQIALVVYKYFEADIPEWWRDAEILYSWEQKE